MNLLWYEVGLQITLPAGLLEGSEHTWEVVRCNSEKQELTLRLIPYEQLSQDERSGEISREKQEC